jgi:hypothetical protein
MLERKAKWVTTIFLRRDVLIVGKPLAAQALSFVSHVVSYQKK